MTPKDMPAHVRRDIDRRWMSAVDYGSPVTAWSREMLDVRSERGAPASCQEAIDQLAEARRRERLAVQP
jgi:hypothetical protein